MKSTRLKNWRRWGAVGVLLLMAVWTVARELSSGVPGQLMISAISTEGTNVVLTASVPSGLSQVSLEIRPALNSPWTNAGMLDVPAGGGQFTYTIPKPGDMAFFRLKATSTANSPTPSSESIVSSEVNYVVVAPLGMTSSPDAKTAADREAVFHFKGTIDGSDKIIITRDGALWEHVNWDWPQQAVTVNNTAWDPREKNYIATKGAGRFLTEAFSLEDATLEKIGGRDLVAIERGTNALIVYLDDVQNGSDDYEFKVHFPRVQPKPARAVSPSATLKISAQVDGYEIFKITATEAAWEHGGRENPDEVKLNDVVWSLNETNVLKNEGTNSFLPAGIDFSTAKIISRKGRDVATMWAGADALWVQFADNPNGSDFYELEIAFGR